MSNDNPSETIMLAVGAVVWNEREEIVLVRRLNPPHQNEWSLPGGKVEFGESLRAAVAREVQEETRLAINIVGLVDVAEIVRDAAAGTADKHYVLVDFCARALPGDVVAGSDAAEARWFSLAEIDELPLWSETRRIIAASTKLLEQGLQKALY